MNQFCYRKLPKYKYQLSKGLTISTSIIPEKLIQTDFIKLDTKGEMTIMKYYAWDGTSGAIDHPHNMRASLVHDALYQLMRLGKLDYRAHRNAADDLFYSICREDHAGFFIAGLYRLGLKFFGEKFARPAVKKTYTEICSK